MFLLTYIFHYAVWYKILSNIFIHTLCVCTCMYARVCAHVYVHVCICMYVCVHVCVCVCLNKYSHHIHVCTHTQNYLWKSFILPDNVFYGITRQVLAASCSKLAYHHAVVKHSACRWLTVSVQRAVNRIKLHYKHWSCTCIFLIYPGVPLAMISILLSSQAFLSIHQNILTCYKCK